MVFLHPLFLWALTAVSVPIIIHLFNFRRYKKVYFTNVRFLRQLQQESKSRSRLRELLVLAARCLAIICLVLAFAQPVYHEGRTQIRGGSSDISLYIDNSFSMENVNRQGPLLEIARSRAKEIVTAFGSGHRFQVITNDFEGRHQRFNTSDNAFELIDEIRVSPVVRAYTDVYRRQQDFLSASGSQNKKMYALTDAQKSSFDLEKLSPDTLITASILPIASNRINNLYLDTCWFEDPLQQKGFIQKLHARVLFNSSAPLEAGSAKLILNGKQQAIASFSVDANSEAELLFTFECRETGFHFGSIQIEDYPVTFDDELFFAFNSRVNVAVCLISGKAQPAENAFTSLFRNDSLFTTSAFAEQGIDYNVLRRADVVILNQITDLSSGLMSELIKFSSRGGAIVVIPSGDGSRDDGVLQTLGLPPLGEMDTTSLRTEKIDMSTRFYSGVFEKMEQRMNLPLVRRHFRLQKHSRSNFQTLLRLQNGDDFLGMTNFNHAMVYLFSAPLDGSSGNFHKHALFVPTFYQICFRSLRTPPLFYNVSENVVIALRSNSAAEQPPHIRKLNGDVDIIPEVRNTGNTLSLRTNNQVIAPGFYNVTEGDSAVMPLAFNYRRAESALDCYTADELTTLISEKGWKKVAVVGNTGESISRTILEGAEGKKLWKLFIFLALVFVALEVAFLRLLK